MFMDLPSATIYDELAEHQRNEPWNYQDVVRNLQIWAERFDFAFKLHLSELVIAIDRMNGRRLGQFRPGYNGLGLKGQVTISERHLRANLGSEAWWRVLGTLFHELLHDWQQTHGKPSRGKYHNVEFRRKAADLGLIVDRRGVTQYAPQSPFFELLARYDIEVPNLAQPAPMSRGAGSKLKLWICRCPVRVRVAVPCLNAVCLTCGEKFRRID
jgi:hypothetical protein